MISHCAPKPFCRNDFTPAVSPAEKEEKMWPESWAVATSACELIEEVSVSNVQSQIPVASLAPRGQRLGRKEGLQGSRTRIGRRCTIGISPCRGNPIHDWQAGLSFHTMWDLPSLDLGNVHSGNGDGPLASLPCQAHMMSWVLYRSPFWNE